MTTLIYAKLPFEQIHYLDRPEFHKEEIVFKTRLMESMKKRGIIDPLYAEVGHHYGRYIKIIVGNNRMATAKILGIKTIPVIVNIYDPTFKLEGRKLKTDDEKASGILKRYLPVKDDKISFKKTGKILDITIPEEMFRADGLHAIKHFVQTDVFKFIPTLDQVNFIESHVNKKPKSTEKTKSKTKTTKAKAP